MPVQNSEEAGVFNKLADLLEIGGDNPFKGRAYRDAARTVIHWHARGWSRSEAESLVESLGGRMPSNVSANMDYIVAGPDAGSQLDEARERDVS